MNEWNIQSRAHACEACGQPFADKQPYHTVLSDDGKELRRSDICEPCMQKGGDLRSRTGFISQWNGIFEVPPPVTEAIQKDTASVATVSASAAPNRSTVSSTRPPLTSSR